MSLHVVVVVMVVVIVVMMVVRRSHGTTARVIVVIIVIIIVIIIIITVRILEIYMLIGKFDVAASWRLSVGVVEVQRHLLAGGGGGR